MFVREIFLRDVQETSVGTIHTADAFGFSVTEKEKNNKQI